MNYRHYLRKLGIYAELADPQNVLLVLAIIKKGTTYPFLKTIDTIEDCN